MLYCGAAVLVVAVTTVLNLDTAVTFLTPVVIYAARDRDDLEVPLVYACLLLANAGSLLLPGSNLTNLIVLGHLRLSGAQFLAHMSPAALAARGRDGARRGRAPPSPSASRPSTPGRQPAHPCSERGWRQSRRSPSSCSFSGRAPPRWRSSAPASPWSRCGGAPAAAAGVLSAPLLAGLFGIAVALGALGRTWSGPLTLLLHLGPWGAAALGGLASLLVNNLPAASLLAARTPPHPFPLLVGLNVGPNLFVTGSLAWVLWLKSARAAGARPSVRRAALLGLASAPLAAAAAVGLLVVTGTR